MPELDLLFKLLGLVVVGMPVLLVLLLGVSSLLERPFSEKLIGRFVQTAIISGLIAALVILGLMLTYNIRHVPIALGTWVELHGGHDLPEAHEHLWQFTIKFTFDRLSVPFVILTFVLCGTIGAFANRYLHREKGFNRFFVLYSFFLMGMITATLAGTIETLFAGWEMVGLSSAMLVAFFHDRPAPVNNGLRVWTVYRVSDAALLIASVVMHHLTTHGDFDLLLGTTDASRGWPDGTTTVTEYQALVIGLLLILAAAGKSALVPFSGWLPRAMEGPTPSSAVFYGALSVHLGAFLLLRFLPIIHASIWLRLVLIMIGLSTSAVAALAERVQTDIKSDLSFASLIQVGFIVAEIGLGVPAYLVLIHILGHACFRTLQFLRAPTLLHDYHIMENAIGTHLPRAKWSWHVWTPKHLSQSMYRLAIEKGYLDAWLTDYLARPFLQLFRWCDAMERRWTGFLTGGRSRDPEQADAFEELL